ncbi:MAG: hypothetical protein GX795_01200 [Firmicutes bacterium]|jgi:type I restriction enzyme S subunit|nr:hypothetical protein [Bacillota bacterium]
MESTKDWKSKPLRDLATINYGRSPAEILAIDGIYPVVGTGGSERLGNDYLYEGESIILGRKGTIDRVHFVIGRFWTIDTAYYLSGFSESCPRWLFYYLQTVDLRHMNEATGVPSLSRDSLYKIQIPTPPRREQTQIAEILSTVDRAIDQAEALIAKQERIKTGLMQDLLTRGIDEHGNIRSEETHQFKDSPLGGIPVEWEVTTLGTAVGRNKGSVQTGPFGSQLHAEDYRETGVPIITVEHLSQNRILHRNLPLVGEEDYRRLVKYTLCEGDLVFSRVGAIDRCSYVSKDENGWLFSGRCFRVRSGQEINSRYLSYQLNHDKARNWILNNSVGTTMACLNTSILSMTPVLLPQQKEQAQVARLLDFISDAIQYELLRKAKLNSLKTGLMQDLLTGKIRVTSLLDNMEVTNR